MTGDVFDAADAAQLRERGVTLEEALRQLELFRRSGQYSKLARACTVGDGIERIGEDQTEQLLALHAEAAAAGRVTKFVPASGAASRMFKGLLHYHKGPGRSASWDEIREQAADGPGPAHDLTTFMERLERFPFADDLARTLRSRGEDLGELAGTGRFAPLLEALLESDGLGYARLPKGLLKFHSYEEGSRTAFEEHLVEAADYARDREGVSRLHLTVSAEHRKGFDSLFAEIEARYRDRYDCRFEIGYSVQKPSTDTLAVDLDDRPLRDERSRLRFRPGGHGALIENLNDLGGDLVFVKNIDNIQPDGRKGEALRWKKLLGGYLVRLQQRAFDYLGRLRRADPPRQRVDEAMEFARRSLNVTTDPTRDPMTFQAARAFLIDRLNRPLRVCGVVPNTGEPGGGPFWVADEWGAASLQIVETAQVDPEDSRQQQILRQATHFNPVDLVCAVRDLDGRVFDLRSYVDPEAVLISRKSDAGHELRALERPGLWNGAMARWNTAFVEVPLVTFSPVKSVLDLLRDEHQPGQ